MSEASALPLFDNAIFEGVQPQSLKPIVKPKTGNYVAVVNRVSSKEGTLKFKDANGAEQVVPVTRVWLGYSIPQGVGDDGIELSWPGELATLVAPNHLAQIPVDQRWLGGGLPGDVWPDGKPRPGALNRLVGNIANALGIPATSVTGDFNGAMAALKSAIDVGLQVNLYVKNIPSKKGGEPRVEEFIQSIAAS